MTSRKNYTPVNSRQFVFFKLSTNEFLFVYSLRRSTFSTNGQSNLQSCIHLHLSKACVDPEGLFPF